MTFTITSRGRAIGITDLGFHRTSSCSRFGWFYPNAQGTKLMPVISSMLPALRAYVQSSRGVDYPARAAELDLGDTVSAI